MEKRKKFKILKRILPIICAVLCIATALATPIGAVINSSHGSYNNYDITGRSTFPMTVGFSYATRDLSTGAGASYVYSTYVGQYGVEFNDTKYGNEQYTLEYDPYGNGTTTYDVIGKLVYSLGAEEWGVSTEVETNSSFRLGRRRISMSNNTPESSNVAGLQQGVVLRADDIVFNPHTIVDSWELETTVVGGQTINRYTYSLKDEMDWSYSVPSFLTPTPLAYANNLGIEMTYSWSADVMDNNGTVRHYSGTAVYDNRITGYQQELVPIMSAEALLGQIGGYGNGGQISDTIVIENYYGYLEYKYYEYQAPQIEFTLNGTTYACPYGMTWGEYADLDTPEYPASSNADVRWLDSTDGTGMQFNNNGVWQFILYNDEVVDNTDTIIGRAVYTLEEPSIPPTQLIVAIGNMAETVDITEFNGKTWNEAFKSYSLPEGFLVGENDTRVQLIYHPSGSAWYSGYIVSNGNYVSSNTVITAGTLYTCSMSATDDPLLGTWVIGDFSSNPNAFNCHLNFTSNGQSYKTFTAALNLYIYYTPSSGGSDVFAYQNGSWTKSYYKTITITTPYDEIIESQAKLMLQFLSNYATRTSAANVASTMAYSADMGEEIIPNTAIASPLAIETPTTTASGTWTEVERSESAEFVLYYPLLDTSGIRITNTPAYNAYYNRYSMPNMVKFRNTMGIPIPSLEVDYTSWIGTAVGGFLNMELMPNFSLGGILAILIAFAITMLFLKFFAGG